MHLEKGPYFSPCSCKQEIGAIYWKGGKIELADVCMRRGERVFENGLIVRIRLACSLPRQKSPASR